MRRTAFERTFLQRFLDAFFDGRDPYDCRCPGLDLTVQRVRDGADDGDQGNRGERRPHGRPGRVGRAEDQQRHDHCPAADAEQGAEEPGDQADDDEPHSRILGPVADAQGLLSALAADPERAAVMLDVDGTLAPIVARPELASVPEETRGELSRLLDRYALLACVSGRTGEDAARVVGLEGAVYVGVHGLELAPEAERWRGPLQEFAETVRWPIEDKGLAVVFHYREAADEEAALTKLRGVAAHARTLGLEANFGRKVLEVRPPVAADKGTAVRRLLEQRGLRRALYAGDDTTDLDAFRGLDGLEVAVRIAVASAEGPPELREAADLVVEGPDELVRVLRNL